MKRLPLLLFAFAVLSFTKQEVPWNRNTAIYDSVTVQVKNGEPLNIGKGWLIHTVAFTGLNKNKKIDVTVEKTKWAEYYGVAFVLNLDLVTNRIIISWE